MGIQYKSAPAAEPALSLSICVSISRWAFNHIISKPVDSCYRAYPLAVPEVVAQGETPQAAKEKVTEALRAYLVEMLAQGKPLPVERKLVDTAVISLA